MAQSFARVHRSNLVGMGVLRCQFQEGTNAASLNLDGTETFDITGLESGEVKPRQDVIYFGSLDGQFSPDKQLAQRLQLNFIQARSKILKEKQDEGSATEKGGEATSQPPYGYAYIRRRS